MDGQTPEVSTMPQQQQPQQQQANVSQNVQGCARQTWMQVVKVYPVQGCQQGSMPVMQGQGPAWFGAQWIPQQQTFMQQTAQARVPSFFGCASMPGGPRSGNVPNLEVNPMNYQGNMPSGPVGATLGGLTPQAAQIQEVMAMLGNLNEGQLQTVQQHMQDRFVTMQQRRGVPEVFGDGLGRAADSSFVTPQPFDVLPGFGVQQSNNHGNQQQLDVFAKSEKWLTPAPTPVSTWKSREEEVLGWAGYLDELSSWAAGGSLEFSVEIQHSSRWPGPIRWSALSSVQQARSRRLMSILKAAFHDNPRCVALVQAFSEGVSLHSVGSDDRTVATNYFSEALGGLVVFIYPKVNSWGPLIDEADCLKSSGSLVSLQPRGFSSGAGYCHFLRRLRRASRGARKQGAILLAQLAGNHAKSAATPLVRLMPPCGRSCG